MKLTYKVHLDDYHAKREAEVASKDEAHALLAAEWDAGYDVGEARLDGEQVI